MRVLLITDWMPDPGGVEAYVTWVREGLRAAGDEVRLLTSSAGSAAEGSADYLAYGTKRLAGQVFLQVVNPFAMARVRSALREFGPDVVHVNTFEYHLSPAILGQLRGVPTVLSITDYKSVCPIGSKLLPNGSLCTEPAGSICWRYGCVSLPHWLRDRPRYALRRSEAQHVRRVLTCSRWMQRELARDGVAADVVYPPVPPPSPAFRRAPATEPVFTYCGRLSVEKGLPLLLRAFARLRKDVPTARLRIVGDGPQRLVLEQLAGSLALQGAVSFTGRVAPGAVEQQLVDAWALVAPSLWAEPLGLVALEAIVRGVPVIASASGGFGETVADGVTGLFFPNGDEEELLQRLQAIAHRQAFPSHSLPDDIVRRVIESHSLKRHIECLRRVFGEIAMPIETHL